MKQAGVSRYQRQGTGGGDEIDRRGVSLRKDGETSADELGGISKPIKVSVKKK